MELEFNRLGYRFRYFFDCDVDELGHIDVEGVEIYNEGEEQPIAVVDFADYNEVSKMSDDELLNFVDENIGVGV